MKNIALYQRDIALTIGRVLASRSTLMKKTRQPQKPQSREINWQPISRLAIVAQQIDIGVSITEKHHLNVTERLHVFDNELIARLKKIIGERLVTFLENSHDSIHDHVMLTAYLGKIFRIRRMAISFRRRILSIADLSIYCE
jgi:hypothetical protein